MGKSLYNHAGKNWKQAYINFIVENKAMEFAISTGEKQAFGITDLSKKELDAGLAASTLVRATPKMNYRFAEFKDWILSRRPVKSPKWEDPSGSSATTLFLRGNLTFYHFEKFYTDEDKKGVIFYHYEKR